LPVIALATGIFSDVDDNHSFKGEIESLVRSGVIHGNPDGSFRPDRTLNRAEFLKMLYLASGRVPKPVYAGCFPDVESGSWYELYVCDAAAKENRFVQGYADGKFKPGSPVSRTEALKMLYEVLGIDVPDITADNKSIIKFVDISVSAWYSKYISAAYITGVLPITGQSGARFYPDQPMTRGEAAAYIWNGLNALEKQKAVAPNTVTSASSASSSSSSVSSAVVGDSVKEVVFPFTDSGKFQKKKAVAYKFNLSEKTSVWTKITLGSVGPEVSCRLYMMTADGFSNEYYLGYQFGNNCTIKATTGPGDYQLQIQPTQEDVSYSVQTKVDVTDGNDGFLEAVKIQFGKAISAWLKPNDVYDWYSFSVTEEKTAKIVFSSTQPLDCVIYTPASVDQFGFTGPQCNVSYKYSPSDEPYMIGIARKGQPAFKVMYTIKVE